MLLCSAKGFPMKTLLIQEVSEISIVITARKREKTPNFYLKKELKNTFQGFVEHALI